MKESSTLGFETAGGPIEHPACEPPVSDNLRESVVEKVVRFRASIGDAVDDEQFTHIAARFFPLEPNGFSFACFSEGCIILNVPAQALCDWYPGPEWISPIKERIAKKIADSFDLTVCEPPDRRDYIVPPASTHHHLEMVTHSESVVVAHPLFLKIRVFEESSNKRFWPRRENLPGPAQLFEALKPLYTRKP